MPPYDPDPEAIERIAGLTLAHHETHADKFWQGTRDHDVSQNIAVLLHYIEAPPPLIRRIRCEIS